MIPSLQKIPNPPDAQPLEGRTMANSTNGGIPIKDDPLWYKDALIYQLHVRAFADSDGDGVGDFQGLTEKLDYLQDLGVTTIWLLPFYPSPLRDDGYDIADYTSVHQMYGSLHDFQVFLEQAHRHGLRVITELVVNHTSDQHPWFQRARRASPDSPWRDFYVWSDTTDLYKETRIIFKDFEFSNWSWDPVAKAYYWHRFYSHQPDLNFDNPQVQEELLKVVDFWLEMGVDGLRLDAVPYLYEREGTNCENLPETHDFLKKLRAHVDTHFSDRMLLAEANQWPEDAVAYFGNGDECHMAFHFPLMPRMFIALRTEDRFPITETLYQTPKIPDSCQWALFLRNHDELTLEMVTAEERAYMYRTFARNPRARINLGIRRRLAPLLQNDRKQVELLNSLLFALPGTPVVYYGDEIGMGDNIYLGDRDGVRTPMQWSHELNAGFSRANPQRIFLPVTIDPEYHYEVINVEAQEDNPYSLLRWMKHLIATRKRYQAFSRGNLQFLQPENRHVLVFIRQYEDEHILVVANLSRFIQCVELDLREFEGMIPIEVFSQTAFPAIGELPYFLTLGPHAFYWFALDPTGVSSRTKPSFSSAERATITVSDDWTSLLLKKQERTILESMLPTYLNRCRWFDGKTRFILSTTISEVIPVPYDRPIGYLTLIQVEYVESDIETYILPLIYATGAEADRIMEEVPQAAIASVDLPKHDEIGILYDAMYNHQFAVTLLEAIAQHRSFRGNSGEVMAFPIRSFSLRSSTREQYTSTAVHNGDRDSTPLQEPTNSSDESVTAWDGSHTIVDYNDQYTLKLFRRVEAGINPDLEIGRFLTEKVSLARAPQVFGAFEYHQRGSDPATIAILHKAVPNQGTAWRHTQTVLKHYYEGVQRTQANDPLPLPQHHVFELANEMIDEQAASLIGSYLETAQLLGQRTAELHLAFTQETEDGHFTPEPFTDFFQRPFYYAMLGLIDRDFRLLRQQQQHLETSVREDVERVLSLEHEMRQYFKPFRDRKVTAMRMRCHGNYHLGNVLWTDNDFVIVDFEGEPTRSLEERRTKTSPLRDVASMLRSFQYAAYASLRSQETEDMLQTVDQHSRENWARFWYTWVSAAFLRTYLDTASQSPLLLQTPDECQMLLDAYLLEKALYELGYELSHRPEWIRIPLQGIIQLLETQIGN